MSLYLKKQTLVSLLMTFLFGNLLGQSEERGDPNFRRLANIDVNRVEHLYIIGDLVVIQEWRVVSFTSGQPIVVEVI